MKIRCEAFEIPTAPMGGVNPLPQFRSRRPNEFKADSSLPEDLKYDLGNVTKVLPYLTQDRYNRQRKVVGLKSIVLENEYLIARFLPEYGGRLHSLYDKKAGRELLFANSVIQPCNLAIRNAWLSGGIEWNVGCFGHTYTTCDNVFCVIMNDGEGNDFLRIYEFERNKSVFWQVDFHLPDGSPHLISHVKIINPFKEATTMYWWTNIAVPDDGKTRVLASNKHVISFVDNACSFERLPYLKAFDGKDMSYPVNASRAFDFFIQKDEDGESTWEAAAYSDGTVFYERSTAPLYYKKLFCWGNHRAGDHWQEFLSEGEGTGYYAEIQAGIAPSQLHDKTMPGECEYEWTQCFGGMSLDKSVLFGEDYDAAVAYFDGKLDAVMSKCDIETLDERMTRLARLIPEAQNICHRGSGFGALEVLRMEKDNDGKAPKTMLFPTDTIGSAESIWLGLLTDGIIKEDDPKAIRESYMISTKWLDRIFASLKTDGGYNWHSLLHAGIAVYEYHNVGVTARISYSEDENKRQTEKARELWLASVKEMENYWAYRNLAVLEAQAGNYDLTEKYYDLAIACDGAFDDFALASEYMCFLVKVKKHEKLWQLYQTLPDSCKAVDRVKISAAQAAVKLGEIEYLNQFFIEEHYDVREGESSLTDVWFEYCALKMAKERGIENPDSHTIDTLIDEAWDLYPPNKEIDFRMSADKKDRYRVSD